MSERASIMNKQKTLIATALLSQTIMASMSAAQQVLPRDLAAAEARAAATVRQMSAPEKVVLTHGIMPLPLTATPVSLPPEAIPGAGYIEGIKRLGVPALKETDAS